MHSTIKEDGFDTLDVCTSIVQREKVRCLSLSAAERSMNINMLIGSWFPAHDCILPSHLPRPDKSKVVVKVSKIAFTCSITALGTQLFCCARNRFLGRDNLLVIARCNALDPRQDQRQENTRYNASNILHVPLQPMTVM